jgi:hypothetical protein
MPTPGDASNTLTWWLRRFQARRTTDGGYALRDWLQPNGRRVPADVVAGLGGAQLETALFQHGFVQPAMSAFASTVNQQPEWDRDAMFWQFPCRTEGAAWEAHADLEVSPLTNGALNVYLGLPWATWIDKTRKSSWGEQGDTAKQQQLRLLRIQLSGLRHALHELGVGLRVHTVCQHVYWQDMLSDWARLGLTDLWLSHCPPEADRHLSLPGAMNLHPWHLYAVNVEDTDRRIGLRIAADPASKPLLASFVGAHADHYLSDARRRLAGLAGEPGFHVRLTDKWHFEDVVYQHQVRNLPLAQSYSIDDSVRNYNQVLSDSVFSLCPSGAGPNSLRLWESLAVGSVPVLFSTAPEMPRGGSLAEIDWESIVLRVPDDQIAMLPRILGAIPMEDIRRRQQMGLRAYAKVCKQRCF